MGLELSWRIYSRALTLFQLAIACGLTQSYVLSQSIALLHARKVRPTKIKRAVAATTSRGVVRRVRLQPIDFADMEV